MICLQIAIDGPTASGKSSIAKAVAQSLGYIHIDTGAMYRAMALYAIENSITWTNEQGLTKLLESIDIDIKHVDQVQRVFLCGKDITIKIRDNDIGLGASSVAKYPAVRQKFVVYAQSLANNKNVVMDGRDIGTVVLKNADVKIYLYADVDIRAKRRVEELKLLGHNPTLKEVKQKLEQRDYDDMNRAITPLAVAKDAIKLDTSLLSQEGALNAILGIVNNMKGV